MGKATARFYNEKGPDALKGTPVYEEALQKEQKVVFTGNAVEAIRLFPTKVNVTVAASRASVGPEAMQVTIQSTPGFRGTPSGWRSGTTRYMPSWMCTVRRPR